MALCAADFHVEMILPINERCYFIDVNNGLRRQHLRVSYFGYFIH